MSNVTDNTAKNRYELMTDGHLSIADYRREGDSIAILHVEVPPELRGQGVAARLMAGILLDAQEKKLKVVPVCSYAVSYMQRHS